MKIDFMKDCKKVRLGDICEIIMGQSPNSQNYNNENIGLPLIQGNADIYKNHLSPHMFTSIITKTCEINDIIMSVRAPVGAVVIADIKACIGRGVCAIRTFENQKYIYQYLLYFKNKWKNISQGSTFESVNSNQIYNLSIPLPPIEEQQKIAEILSTQDKVIELKQKLIDQKKQQKKWLMQNLLTGRIRLKGFEGEWEKVRLGDIFSERTERNFENLMLLSVTGTHGIIPRSELNLKDNSSEDKSKYLKICVGDIGYNTMRMWQGVSAYSNYEGIVSPAYTVLKPSACVNSKYFLYLFKMPKIISNFYRFSQGLVDDTRNLKYNNFSKIKVFYPVEKNEQTAIAEILSAQDKEIELLEKQLEQEKLKKKALMQLLLTVK